MDKFLITLIVSAAGMLAAMLAEPALASGISATTIGTQSAQSIDINTGTATPTPGFYTVWYQGNGPAITSISYNLSSGYFDFDTTDGGSAGPVMNTSGLSNGNVSATPVSGYPSQLTFNFGTNTFQGNNTFSFGAVADYVNGDPNPYGSNGVDFGAAHIPFTVTFATGKTVSADFAVDPALGPNASALYLAAPTAVPLPGAVWLFGTGLIAVAASARRRNRC